MLATPLGLGRDFEKAVVRPRGMAGRDSYGFERVNDRYNSLRSIRAARDGRR